MAEEISVEELKKILDSGEAIQLLDVRPEEMFSTGHVETAYIQNVPLQELPNKVFELDRKRPVYIICQEGNASRYAAAYLSEEEFLVYTVQGGTAEWGKTYPEQIKFKT